MDLNSLDIAGLGFWLAVGMAASAWIWSNVKKQQMKHDLTLKLLEKGQSVDQELLAKLLASDKPAAVAQKSIAEQHRDGGGVAGFLFLVAGLILAAIGIMGSREMVPVGGGGQLPGGIPLAPMMMFQNTGPNWLLIGLGAFSFAFGYLVIRGSIKEYEKAKAEEKLSRD